MTKILNFAGLGDLGKIVSPQDPYGGKSIVGDMIVETDVTIPRVGDVTSVGDFKVYTDPPQKSISSKKSSVGPYNALFNRLVFTADVIYNFYVEDENVNDTEEPADRLLKDIPRYVILKWKTAPTSLKKEKVQATTKRFKSSSTVKTDPLRQTIDPKFFKSIKNATVNGFISPGVISSVVEKPISRMLGIDNKIDEQSFLTSTDMYGLSIHDVQANINKKSSGVLITEKIAREVKDSTDFSGGYSVTRDLVGGGISTVASLPSSPVIGMRLATSKGNFGRKSDIGKVASTLKSAPRTKSSFTEVNFVDPAITGIVSEKKVGLITAPEHAENMTKIAQIIPNLSVLSETVGDIGRKLTFPYFPGTKDESGTEYIGFVIEKFVQRDDGAFELMEEIDIPNPKVTEHIDTKVLYGSTYRYRIRTILRWTRPGNVDIGGIEEGNFFDDDFSQTKGISSQKSSYFSSEWNREWKYVSILDMIPPPPPDEFRVRPDSRKKRVLVSWKVPDDRQRDISGYHLYRKEIDSLGQSTSDWEKVAEMFGAVNILYIDNDVQYLNESNGGYAYTAQTVTKHNEESLLSCQIGVFLNASYDVNDEYDVIQLSEQGVDREAIGSFSVKPVKRSFSELIVKETVCITSRNGLGTFAFANKTYVLRAESLATGKKSDVSLILFYDNLNPLVRDHKTIVSVDTKPAEQFVYGETRSIGKL